MTMSFLAVEAETAFKNLHTPQRHFFTMLLFNCHINFIEALSVFFCNNHIASHSQPRSPHAEFCHKFTTNHKQAQVLKFSPNIISQALNLFDPLLRPSLP